MISIRFVQRGLAAVLALSLLAAGPVWAEEPLGIPGRIPAAGPGETYFIPRVDLRAAAKACVLSETGLDSPFPSGVEPRINPGAEQNAGAAATRPPAARKSAVADTAPPDAPRTTHTQKVAAFTALAVLAAVSTVFIVRAVHHKDPVLTPGTPTRIP